jgi:hypothetical protein
MMGGMKKPFLSTILKQVFFALAAAVAAALILELGFRLRDWRQNMALRPPPAESGAKTVLMIGDSVLGTSPDSSLVRYLETDLRRRSGEPFAVRNLSRSKNSSVWVDAFLSDYLRDYHPQYVILLLGKNDMHGSALAGDEWWSNLKIYRFYQLVLESADILAQKLKQSGSTSREMLEFERLEMLYDWYVRGHREAIEELAAMPVSASLKRSDRYYSFCLATALRAPAPLNLVSQAKECMHDLEKAQASPAYVSSIKAEIGRSLFQLGKADEARQSLEEALQLNPANLLAQIMLGFLFADRHECGKAIPYFENALRKMEPGLASICFGLYKCFVAEKKQKDGETFFAELERSRPGLCPRHALTSLREQKTGYAGYRETILKPKDRGEFLAKLYYFRQRYDVGGPEEKNEFSERARSWFQRAEDFPELQMKTLNQELFDRILQRLSRHGIKTLVLGYPDLPDRNLSESVGRMGGDFHFLSLHSVMIEASRQTPLFELLTDDFVHPTDRGHQIAASAISQALLNFAPSKP